MTENRSRRNLTRKKSRKTRKKRKKLGIWILKMIKPRNQKTKELRK
jgi:hypothetical protein